MKYKVHPTLLGIRVSTPDTIIIYYVILARTEHMWKINVYRISELCCGFFNIINNLYWNMSTCMYVHIWMGLHWPSFLQCPQLCMHAQKPHENFSPTKEHTPLTIRLQFQCLAANLTATTFSKSSPLSVESIVFRKQCKPVPGFKFTWQWCRVSANTPLTKNSTKNVQFQIPCRSWQARFKPATCTKPIELHENEYKRNLWVLCNWKQHVEIVFVVGNYIAKSFDTERLLKFVTAFAGYK